MSLHRGLGGQGGQGDTRRGRDRWGTGDCLHTPGPGSRLVRGAEIPAVHIVLTSKLHRGHLLIFKVCISVTHISDSVTKRDRVSIPSVHFQMCPVNNMSFQKGKRKLIEFLIFDFWVLCQTILKHIRSSPALLGSFLLLCSDLLCSLIMHLC